MVKEIVPLVAALAICATATSGCDDGGSEGTLPQVTSATELRIGDVPIFSIDGPGGTDPPFHQIASVIILANGDLAIADQTPRIVVIDSEGALVQSFGRSGDGPGEFRSVAWVQQAPGDSLVVYDALLSRASIFSSDGVHTRTITLDPRPGGRPPAILGLFDDGEFLGAEPLLAPPPEGGAGIVRPEMIVSRHDRDGGFLDSLAVLPGSERAIADGVLLGDMPLLRSTNIVVDGSMFHVATGERWEVATRDRDGVLVRTLGDGGEPEPVTQEVIESAEVPEPLVPLLPSSLPAVAHIISDRLGRLWVSPYVVGSRQESVSWTVFNSEGERVSEVEMPSGFRPLDAGTSQVIGIWKDDLGVEHLRLYPIIEAAPG